MEKINVEEVCKAYNLTRDKHAGKKMPRNMIINLLKEAGLSGAIITRLITCPTLFTKFRREGAGRGNHVGYIWPTSSIHVNLIRNWLYPAKKEKVIKNTFDEEGCVEYLRKQGYKLKKCIGFDEDAFKKDYPQIYQKYLIYENV